MRASTLWRAPVVGALGTLAAYVAIADTDTFFWLGFLMAPVGIAIFLCSAILEIAFERFRPTAGVVALSAIAVVAAWLLVQLSCVYVRDKVRFTAWSVTHSEELAAAARNDGLLKPWESTGFLDMTDDTYLVGDRDDTLAAAATLGWGRLGPAQANVANQWVRTHNIFCEEIDRVEKMASGLYLSIARMAPAWTRPRSRAGKSTAIDIAPFCADPA